MNISLEGTLKPHQKSTHNFRTMTALQQRNDSTANNIEQLQLQIQGIQEQLNLLNQEVRVTSQRHEAQQTLAKEWDKQLQTMTKLFKDSCSVYGDAQAMQDMVNDVKSLVDGVTENFDDYAQSDRFLNAETADLEDVQDDEQPAKPERLTLVSADEMPEPDDNKTPLTASQAKELIGHLDKTQLSQFSIMASLGTLSSLKSIANKIAKLGTTRYEVEWALESIQRRALKAG